MNRIKYYYEKLKSDVIFVLSKGITGQVLRKWVHQAFKMSSTQQTVLLLSGEWDTITLMQGTVWQWKFYLLELDFIVLTALKIWMWFVTNQMVRSLYNNIKDFTFILIITYNIRYEIVFLDVYL